MRAPSWRERARGAVRRRLTPHQHDQARRWYVHLLSRLYATDLSKLAVIHGTDKWNNHWYTQHYEKHFRELRRRRMNVLEIGVGGYDRPNEGGASLRMWKYYFPNSRIFAIDIYDKSALSEARIEIFRGSQADPSFLRDVFERIGSLDIVIDDGSHVNEHVLTSFTTLFPLLNEGGIYAIEDTDHSYIPRDGGDNRDLNNPRTVMNVFKNLADGLNYEALHLLGVPHEPSYIDRNVLSLHFYYNLIIVQKGTEPRQFWNGR